MGCEVLSREAELPETRFGNDGSKRSLVACSGDDGSGWASVACSRDDGSGWNPAVCSGG